MGTYLDHAATSHPKAPGVADAMRRALSIGASAQRSGHRLGMEATAYVQEVRRKVADRFGLDSSDSVVFTPGATYALNLAIRGFVLPGDHVVATPWAHNAVLRPLARLSSNGCDVDIASARGIGADLVEAVLREIRPNTRLVVISHASNVCGTLLPVRAIGEAARGRGIAVLLDAAQTAGHRSIDMESLPVDMVAFGGHKAMLGPPGIGCLLIGNPGLEIQPLVEGGTGHDPVESRPRPTRPSGLEAGTPNLPAIAGLGAALDFLETEGHRAAIRNAREMRGDCIKRLMGLRGIELYLHADLESEPIVAFNVRGVSPSDTATFLDRRHDLQSRAGLHCAPLAHRALGTGRDGAVRVSFGYGNAPSCVERLEQALADLIRTRGGS